MEPKRKLGRSPDYEPPVAMTVTINPKIKAALDDLCRQSHLNHSYFVTEALKALLHDPYPFFPKIMTERRPVNANGS